MGWFSGRGPRSVVRRERGRGSVVQRERRPCLVVGVRRSRAGWRGRPGGSGQLERDRVGSSGIEWGQASWPPADRSGQRGREGRFGGRSGGPGRGAQSGRAGAFARHDAERQADFGGGRCPEPIRLVVTGRRPRPVGTAMQPERGRYGRSGSPCEAAGQARLHSAPGSAFRRRPVRARRRTDRRSPPPVGIESTEDIDAVGRPDMG